MTFQDQESGNNKTATLTVRNIPPDVDAEITLQAGRAGKSKSDFLREFLTQEFQDLIKNFCRSSQLVEVMDEELSKRYGIAVALGWYDNHMITYYNRQHVKLLGLNTHDDLQQLMMRNMPYLHLRASQVLHSDFAYIPRGLSLTFSIFIEIASRDDRTINAAFTNVFYVNGADKFYGDINDIRRAMKLQPVDKL